MKEFRSELGDIVQGLYDLRQHIGHLLEIAYSMTAKSEAAELRELADRLRRLYEDSEGIRMFVQRFERWTLRAGEWAEMTKDHSAENRRRRR